MSLRSQLAELDVVDDVSENFVGCAGISVVASHISVVFGDRIAALHQLVATLWDSNFFEYELLAAQPPTPERFNGQRCQQFELEDMPAYCSSGLGSPRSYWHIKWTEKYAPAHRVHVDSVQEGPAMIDPVSRIFVAPRVVISPDAFVRDVVQQQLYWDATNNNFTNRQPVVSSS